MRSLLVALLCTTMFAFVGCSSDNKHDSKKSGDAMNASADACSHCAGVQKATADGKCPMCGMKVSSAASMSGADACAKCPGVQTASADGKCSACGAKVATN